MLVLHPSSTCDVCLEGYTGRNFPNVICCGHSFCLGCLQSLTRQCCPLCRTPFSAADVRRLHIDRGSPHLLPSRNAVDAEEESSQYRQFQDRVTRIVFEGADNAELEQFSKDVDKWLRTQPSDEHTHLRAVTLLLRKHINMLPHYKAAQRNVTQLQQTADELKEKLHSEREAAWARYEELQRSSAVELEKAKSAEKTLREKFELAENDWTMKYEVCVAECRSLLEEVKELRQKHLNPSGLARTVEARYLPSTQDPIVVMKEDAHDAVHILQNRKVTVEDGFHLSPIPHDISLPSLPSGTFRALTEESDDDDIGKALLRRSERSSTRRSIPFQSSPHRMRSNSSLLSRYDEPVSRSLPKASVESYMSSCSSSPSLLGYSRASRERPGDAISCSPGAQEGALDLRMADSNRSSDVSEADGRDAEAQLEHWRAQLRATLNDSPAATLVRRNTVSVTEHRGTSYVSSSATRNTSPMSSSPPATSCTSAPTHSSTSVPTPTQHQPLSRASEAAMAAERARASAASSMSSSPTSTMASRERDAVMPPAQPYPQAKPSPQRRMSTDGVKARSPTATATASNLTRTIWAMQDGLRLSHQEAQRV